MNNVVYPKHRFQVLDIFRGIFAFFVFLYHLYPFADTVIINNEIIHNSDLFVDFFFVLSGFVISLNYSRIENLEQSFSFLKKRFFRVYPMHLFMLMLFLGVELAKNVLSSHIHVNNLNNASNNINSFILSLSLLHSTPLLHNRDVSWNIPSWSISAEMIAYLVFTFVTLSVTRIYWLRKRSLAVSIIILSFALLLLITVTGAYKINYSYDFGFIRGIIGFYSGVLCFHIFDHSKSKMIKLNKRIFDFLEFITVILIFGAIYNGALLKPYGIIFELLFFISIYVYSFEKGMISNILKNNNVLKKLGSYSYSIYMTHALMISFFNILFIRILHFTPSAYAYLFILNFIVIYLFSSWTYVNIEMKFYKSFNKKK